jgi:hypothetical protein
LTTFFLVAPELLPIRVVVVMPNGDLRPFGPADAPTLYLVHTTNHYMPALRHTPTAPAPAHTTTTPPAPPGRRPEARTPSPSDSGSSSSVSTDTTSSGEATPEVVDQPLAGGVVIARADVDADRYAPLMDPGSRYTIVVDEPMDGEDAVSHLYRVRRHLDSRPDDGLPVVVRVVGEVPSAVAVRQRIQRSEPSAMTAVQVRHLVDQMLRHPRVTAVLGVTEVGNHVAVSALRADQAHPTPWATSAMTRLAASGMSNPAAVVDAPLDQPVIVDALAQALSATDLPRQPGPIQPLALAWNATVAGADGPARLAHRLADPSRVVVEVHGGPEQLWRLATNRIWFTPPEGQDLSPAAHQLLAVEQFAVPPEAAAVAVLYAPPPELRQRQVDAWLDQLAGEGAVDRPLVLSLPGMNAEQSREFARFVQSRIDERLRQSRLAPPGLVASLEWGDEGPARWWWPSPLDGNTATVTHGSSIPTEQEFAEPTSAVEWVLAYRQAPLDVDRVVSDWRAGTPNEWDLSDTDLARLAPESLPWQPTHEERAFWIAADRMVRVVEDRVVPDPVDVLIRRLQAARDRVAGSLDRRREDPDLQWRYGPDPFGLRDRPPAPEFMRGLNIDQLHTDQLVPLLRRLDLANADPREPVDVRDLRPDTDSVWSKRLDEQQRVWAPDADPSTLGEDNWLLPETLEMPTVFHSIWLGSPLSTQRPATDEVRGVLGRLADQVREDGMTMVVWTDVARSEFLDPDPTGEVAQMRDWARQHNILLVNVDEVFHVDAPMVRDSEYRLELAKGVPVGYAAASDILRLEILNRFGGVYTDGDNEFVSLAGLRELLGSRGFGVHRYVTPDVGYGNSALLAARGHPFVRIYLDLLYWNYGYTQPQLYVHRQLYDTGGQLHTRAYRAAPNTRPAHEDVYMRNPHAWARRSSVGGRTGPDNLAELAVRTGHGIPVEFPPITEAQLVLGTAGSWLGGAPGPRYGPDQDLPMLRHAISYLVRDLVNRVGDLNLIAVSPIIERLHDPARGWEAAIGYIFQSPELRMLVRRATYRELVNINGRFGSEAQIEERTLDLPPSVRAILGVPDPRSTDQPSGEWIRGAFSADVPARHWSWLTVDFAEQSAQLPQPHPDLQDLSRQLVIHLLAGSRVRVNVEGGDDRDLSPEQQPEAEPLGQQRAQVVAEQLRQQLQQRNAEAQAGRRPQVDLNQLIINLPPTTRGAGPSPSPLPTMTSPEDRRRVLVRWTIQAAPQSLPTPQPPDVVAPRDDAHDRQTTDDRPVAAPEPPAETPAHPQTGTTESTDPHQPGPLTASPPADLRTGAPPPAALGERPGSPRPVPVAPSSVSPAGPAGEQSGPASQLPASGHDSTPSLSPDDVPRRAGTDRVPTPTPRTREVAPPAQLSAEPRSATRSPSSQAEDLVGAEDGVPVRFGYLAYEWLTRASVGVLTEAGLPDDDARTEAQRVSRLPLEEQAQHAAAHLRDAPGGLRVDGPMWGMPHNRPLGTRIWLASERGNARAVHVLANGNHAVFDPSTNAVLTILARDFPDWVGDLPHLYVVAAPAASPDTFPAAADEGSSPGSPRDASPEPLDGGDLLSGQPPNLARQGDQSDGDAGEYGGVLNEWLAMPEWGKLPADFLQDLGRRYLAARTVDAGIDEVLPDLIGRPHLFEPVARLVELGAGRHGGASYDAALLRATGHTVADESPAVLDLVRAVRPIPGPVKLSWLQRLGDLKRRHPEYEESLDSLCMEIIRCADAQSR